MKIISNLNFDFEMTSQKFDEKDKLINEVL